MIGRHISVHTGDLGRTIVSVFEGGLLVDRVSGYTRADALESARIQYPWIREGRIHRTPMELRLGPPPPLDQAVDEIMQEIVWMRAAGKMRPFVEGEPIGTIPPEHRADLRRS